MMSHPLPPPPQGYPLQDSWCLDVVLPTRVPTYWGWHFWSGYLSAKCQHMLSMMTDLGEAQHMKLNPKSSVLPAQDPGPEAFLYLLTLMWHFRFLSISSDQQRQALACALGDLKV